MVTLSELRVNFELYVQADKLQTDSKILPTPTDIVVVGNYIIHQHTSEHYMRFYYPTAFQQNFAWSHGNTQ